MSHAVDRRTIGARLVDSGSAIVAVTVLALVLRLIGIADKSLWIDEAFSWWLARQPLEPMWRNLLAVDQHPPLYYSLLHLWLAPDAGETGLRAFSVLWGVPTVPLVYLIGRRVAGQGVGLLAAVLQAVSPMHVWYAQQGRMYTMLTFFAAAATLCALRLLGSGAGNPGQKSADPGGSSPGGWKADGGGGAGEEGAARSSYRVSSQGRQRREVPPGPSNSAVDFRRRTPDTRGSTPRAVRWTVGCLAASVTLTMLSHNTGVLLPVVLALAAAAVGVRQRVASRTPEPADDVTVDFAAMTAVVTRPGAELRGLWIGLGLGVAAWLPWLPGFLHQAGRVDAEFWLPAPTGTAVLEHLRNLLSAHAPALPTLVLALAAVALAASGAWRLRGRPEAVLLVALLAGPLVLELLVSIRRPIFYSQTLIWTSVPLVVLAAVALTAIRWRALAAAATAALLVVNLASLVTYYRAGSVEDWEGAALYVAGAAQPGDMVLFNAGWTRIPFDFYFQGVGPAVEEHGVPAELFERGELEPRMSTDDLWRLDDLLDRGHRRVWLVYSHDWWTDPDALIARHLDTVLDPVGERRFTAILVKEYRPTTIGSAGR